MTRFLDRFSQEVDLRSACAWEPTLFQPMTVLTVDAGREMIRSSCNACRLFVRDNPSWVGQIYLNA